MTKEYFFTTRSKSIKSIFNNIINNFDDQNGKIQFIEKINFPLRTWCADTQLKRGGESRLDLHAIINSSISHHQSVPVDITKSTAVSRTAAPAQQHGSSRILAPNMAASSSLPAGRRDWKFHEGRRRKCQETSVCQPRAR